MKTEGEEDARTHGRLGPPNDMVVVGKQFLHLKVVGVHFCGLWFSG